MAVQNSSGNQFSGQNFSPEDNFITRFTQQMMAIQQANALLGTPGVEITPHDKLQVLVRTYTPPTAALIAYLEVTNRTTNINFPDTLNGIDVTFNKNTQNGSTTHSAGTALAVGSGSVSSNPRATGQASASLMPDIAADIQQVWGQNLPVIDYGFWLPSNSNLTALLAKLTAVAGASVTTWPIFKPTATIMRLHGQQVDISATADAEMNASFSDGAHYGYMAGGGGGSSGASGTTSRTQRISPTIHGAITLTYPAGATVSANTITLTATASATAFAATPSVVMSLQNPTNSVTVPAAGGASFTFPATAIATVAPATLSATSGTNVIPTSGIRLQDVRKGPSKWGYTFMTATVFDFANLA